MESQRLQKQQKIQLLSTVAAITDNVGMSVPDPANQGAPEPTVNTRINTKVQPLLDLIGQQQQTINQQAQMLQTQSEQLGTAVSILQGVPTLIETAKGQAIQQAKTELLGGVGTAYDTLLELSNLSLDAKGTAQALTLKVGALETTTATLNTLVNEPGTGLVATATAAKTTAQNTQTGLSQLQATVSTVQSTAQQGVTDAATALMEANKRLLRSGDTASGSIMIPKAIEPAAATRLEQTYGGLNAPIRYATAVGNVSTPMLPGPLTDPTPQGRKAKPYLVILTMRTMPVVGATITIGTTPNGSEVFNKTYLLTGLPVLNNLLAPMQPAFLELPAGTTLYAKATAGTWDVEVLSYYK